MSEPPDHDWYYTYFGSADDGEWLVVDNYELAWRLIHMKITPQQWHESFKTALRR